MKFTIATSTLITLIPFITSTSAHNCDRYSVQTKQSCATQYGNQPAYGVQSTTRTVTKTGQGVTVKATKAAQTYTVTAGEKTVTNEVTSTLLLSKTCNVQTVYATTIVTSQVTISQVQTQGAYVTKTVTGAPNTVPTPYGFVYVSDDPNNQPQRYKRGSYDYAPGPQSYPVAVKCTKTLNKICTHTAYVAPPKVTVTVAGGTKTITQTKTVTNYACANPTVTTATIKSTSTVTITTNLINTLTSTKTITVPGPTTYAACNPRNIYAGVDSVLPQAPTDLVVPAKDAYECCVQCQKHKSSSGANDCSGSYFVADNKAGNKCVLKITDKCPATECKLKFKIQPQSYTPVPKGYISNGVCGKWKLQK